MEVSIQTDEGVRTIETVRDCSIENGNCVLQLENDETQVIEGVLLGATRYWENYGMGDIESDTLTVKLQIDGKLDVPTKPLVQDSDIEDETWEYAEGFDFYPPEIELRDGTCVLRNVTTVAHVDAETSTGEPRPTIHAGDGGFTADSEAPREGPYLTQFDSSWSSYPLHGQVERITSYEKQDDSLEPTEETRKQADWAF